MADQKKIKTYIYLGLSLIIFLVVYFFVYPAVLEVKNTQKEILVLQKTLDQNQETLAKFKEVSEKYKAKQGEFQKISQILSPEPDIIFQLIQFETLANKNGMVMDNISFENIQTTEDGKIGVLPINLQVSGDYFAFQNYLEDLAKNLNLIDVESISFQPIQESTETVKIAKGYAFSLKVNTYTKTVPVSLLAKEEPTTEKSPQEITPVK